MVILSYNTQREGSIGAQFLPPFTSYQNNQHFLICRYMINEPKFVKCHFEAMHLNILARLQSPPVILSDCQWPLLASEGFFKSFPEFIWV